MLSSRIQPLFLTNSQANKPVKANLKWDVAIVTPVDASFLFDKGDLSIKQQQITTIIRET
ncbi:MAG: hypothetical protein SWX82_26245 [Cyanobacteriota bacterium]|nr:hypothetical protein [Cyanobacteriota bacterium]